MQYLFNTLKHHWYIKYKKKLINNHIDKYKNEHKMFSNKTITDILI